MDAVEMRAIGMRSIQVETAEIEDDQRALKISRVGIARLRSLGDDRWHDHGLIVELPRARLRRHGSRDGLHRARRSSRQDDGNEHE